MAWNKCSECCLTLNTCFNNSEVGFIEFVAVVEEVRKERWLDIRGALVR